MVDISKLLLGALDTFSTPVSLDLENTFDRRDLKTAHIYKYDTSRTLSSPSSPLPMSHTVSLQDLEDAL